jgi:membrane associated rhomboid family serine protease
MALGAIVWAVFYVAQFMLAIRNMREQKLDYKPISNIIVESAVKAFGRNTNSVVHLYGKLFYFEPQVQSKFSGPPPLVGYASLPRQNVMITDPLCAPNDEKEVLLEFTNFTQNQQKDCLLFPIDGVTARQAAELGYGILQIGKEPIFSLKDYSSENHDPKILSSIRQALKKGITVENLSRDQISFPQIQEELQEILDEWFLSRRSEKMQLISEVSPFKYAHEKRYFVARSPSHIEAFLACSPVYGKKGFFIHDLIRRPTSINGVSEALIVKALETFKSEGFEFASLGVASLAGLGEPGVNNNYPLLNKVLNHVFNNHEAFMRFKSLYHFKKKFGPTSEEPAFLAFYPPQFKPSYAIAIGGMFSGRGLVGDIFFKWKRWKEGNQLPQPLLNLLSPKVATLSRPVPFTFPEFVSRLRFTFLIFGLNIYTYLNTTSWFGQVSPDTIEKYGFNYKDFIAHKWFILITANFVHFNYFHLLSNMFLLMIFCGALEFIGGTTIAALAFLLSMNANVPTGMLLLPVLKILNLSIWQHAITYLDVGASLGIMGALGALIQFLKNKKHLLIFTCLVTVLLAVVQKNYVGLDHTFAVLLGYMVGHFYLNRKSSKTAFQKLIVSFDSSTLHNSPILFRSRER